MKTAVVYRYRTASGPRRERRPIVSLPSGIRAYAPPDGNPPGQWQLRYWEDGKIRYAPIESRSNYLTEDTARFKEANIRARVTKARDVIRHERLVSGHDLRRATPLTVRDKAQAWLHDLRRNQRREMERQGNYMLFGSKTAGRSPGLLTIVGTSSHAISRENVQRYYAALKASGCGERTVHNRHRCLVQFLKHSKVKVFGDMPPSPRKPKKDVQVCSKADMDALLDYCRQHDRYTLLLIEMGRQLGLRKRELMHAAWSDIDWERGHFVVREKPDAGFTIKNRNERRLPMSNGLIELVRERQHSHGSDRWILGTRTGKVNHSLLKRLKDTVVDAGLPVAEFSLHMLRRKFLTTALRAGLDIETVRKLADHSSIEVTARYLKAIEADQLRGEMTRIFG